MNVKQPLDVEIAQMFSLGKAYERFMGRWSRGLAPGWGPASVPEPCVSPTSDSRSIRHGGVSIFDSLRQSGLVLA